MASIVLGEREFRDKVYACWLGKNIGGTLGAPYECQRYTHDLTFYDPVPDISTPNDDLDLQLVWLVMLEKEGLPPRLPNFARYWRDYLHKYPWNEYGFCNRNLARGLMPPVSGWFENYFVDEMGSPIRSELWACVAPADPQTAAALAWMDSAMDHAGGEGTHGEMFWSAVESAAFVVQDPYELIRIGLAMIPPSCNISRVVREAVWCREHGVRYDDARERITDTYRTGQPCNAIPNHGFTVLGWLYGEDFGDRLCKAVNCGYDTDCTGATLGSVLGILDGTAGIADKWIAPIGTDINLHEFTVDCGVPRSVDELTDRTVALARGYAEARCEVVAFDNATVLPDGLPGILHRTDKTRRALGQDVRCAVELAGDFDLVLHYNGDPVLHRGVSRRFEVSCMKDGAAVAAEVGLAGPAGWQVAKASGEAAVFDVTAPDPTGGGRLEVTAEVGMETVRAGFTVLGPDQARGYPNCQQSTGWAPDA